MPTDDAAAVFPVASVEPKGQRLFPVRGTGRAVAGLAHLVRRAAWRLPAQANTLKNRDRNRLRHRPRPERRDQIKASQQTEAHDGWREPTKHGVHCSISWSCAGFKVGART